MVPQLTVSMGRLLLCVKLFDSLLTICAQQVPKIHYPLYNVTLDDIPQLPVAIIPPMPSMPRDCSEIKDRDPQAGSGIYTIAPVTCPGVYFHVYCDMEAEGGGWTVIMRRFNGTIDFYRGWYFYKSGFGTINGEYYLGNDRISCLTNMRHMELKIGITDVGGIKSYAGYAHFRVGNSSTEFTLEFDSFYGDAGDYLMKSNGRMFSTFDRDNDMTERNCAEYFHSAWWYFPYGNCHHAVNVHGYYFLGKKELPQFAGPGISWRPVPGPGGPALKEVIMKIRPMGYMGGSISSGFSP